MATDSSRPNQRPRVHAADKYELLRVFAELAAADQSIVMRLVRMMASGLEPTKVKQLASDIRSVSPALEQMLARKGVFTNGIDKWRAWATETVTASIAANAGKAEPD